MKIWRFTCMLGSIVVGLAIVSSGSAFAANQSGPKAKAQTEVQWHQAIAKLRTPGSGCYNASYPELKWNATRCEAAPNWAFEPRLLAGSAHPATVGNGVDYSAKVSGKITQATGSFEHVTKGITEKGKVGGEGSQLANAFSLQLNSQFFTDPPACSGTPNPDDCYGWQQFIYAYDYEPGENAVFMEYWIIYLDTTCPAGWNTYKEDGTISCWLNSSASPYGALPAKDLGDIDLAGQASSGGNDQVTLSSTSGKSSSASGSDSVLDLANYWNTTEWGVFGDGGGTKADFGTKTTLEAQTSLQGTSSSAPTCVKEGFTAETNNLDLTKTPATGTESSPTMASKQTNHKATKASCAVAA